MRMETQYMNFTQVQLLQFQSASSQNEDWNRIAPYLCSECERFQSASSQNEDWNSPSSPWANFVVSISERFLAKWGLKLSTGVDALTLANGFQSASSQNEDWNDIRVWETWWQPPFQSASSQNEDWNDWVRYWNNFIIYYFRALPRKMRIETICTYKRSHPYLHSNFRALPRKMRIETRGHCLHLQTPVLFQSASSQNEDWNI